MNINDIIQALSRIQDNQDTTNSTEPNIVAKVNEPAINDNAVVMIPPLQSQIELMKKSVGVDNAYDTEDNIDSVDNTDNCDCDTQDYESEETTNDSDNILTRIVQLSGLQPMNEGSDNQE